MSTTDPLRVAISGAAGSIAYALMFRIANGGLFGHDQPLSLSLLDLPESLPRLEARAMELKDCAYPLLDGLRIGTDPVCAFENADWIILIGGREFYSEPRYRMDLLRANAPIMIDHGRAINQAAPSARVLVATTPRNTSCRIAMSHAPDVPGDHWFALNQDNRSRATAMVAEKTHLPVTQVTRLTVWGNNSETAYVDLFNARIGNQPALQVIKDPDWVRSVLEPAVTGRFRKIVQLIGETPASSTAQAIICTIRAITAPTPLEHSFGAGVLSDGSYDIPRRLVFGFPLTTSDGKTWRIPQGLYLDDHARERIKQNIAELELEARSVSHLLGNV